MKNVVFGLVLLTGLSVALVSCNDDDDSGKSAKIEGSWLLTKQEYKNCGDPDDNGSYSPNCSDEDSQDLCVIMEFDGDGNFTTSGAGGDFGTYKQSGNKVTLCYVGEDCDDAVTVKRDGDKLVVSFEEDDCDGVFTFTLVD